MNWTTTEYRLIQDNPGLTNEELAQMTGRTVNAICCFRTRAGLSRPRDDQWKPEEIEFLRINRKRKNKEIGKALGRTDKAVQYARNKYDLQKRSAE